MENLCGGTALVLDCVATDGALALAAGVIGPGRRHLMWAVEAGSLPVSIVSLPFGCSVHIPGWATASAWPCRGYAGRW